MYAASKKGSRSVKLARLLLCMSSGVALSSCAVGDAENASGSEVGSSEFAIDFEYSNDEMFEFNIERYLDEHGRHLLPHAEEISHVAGEYRVSPRVLIALIEQQSGAVRDAHSQVVTPMGSLSDKTGFLEQIRDVSARIKKAGNDSDLRVVISHPDEAILGVVPAAELVELEDVYKDLFPGVTSEPKLVAKASALVPLQFPWAIGEAWTFGGAHADDGSGTPLSSIDFMRDDGANWGDPIPSKVVASGAGRLKRHSSCYVTIVHNESWSTGYYHLSDIMVADGATVQANQPIAKYANNKSQALCDGGASTGPHLHWTLYNANREADLTGKILSGWTIHPGTSSYDENCARMYLSRDGKKACPWSVVRNDAATTPTPTPTGYEAENFSAQQGCRAVSEYSGFSGTGFVDFGGKSTFVEWNNISVPVAGTYRITLKYANASAGPRTCSVRVNDQAAGSVAFAQTGGTWSTWRTDVVTVTLKQGVNKVRLTASGDTGGPNLDNLSIAKQ